MLKPLLTAALISLILTGTAARATEPAYPALFLKEFSPRSELSDVLSMIHNDLTVYDRDGNGLDATDVTIFERFTQSKFRAYAAFDMLRMDLNADNKVTKDEITAVTLHSPVNNALIELQLNQLMRNDANNDGVVTLDEVLAGAADRRCRRPPDNTAAQWLSLDPNKDGKLTQEELDKIATDVFKSFDTNGDGMISSKEYEAARPTFRIATSEPPRNPDCLRR